MENVSVLNPHPSFSEYIYEYKCLRCGAIICEDIEYLSSHNCLDGAMGYLQAIGKRKKNIKFSRKKHNESN